MITHRRGEVGLTEARKFTHRRGEGGPHRSEEESPTDAGKERMLTTEAVQAVAPTEAGGYTTEAVWVQPTGCTGVI